MRRILLMAWPLLILIFGVSCSKKKDQKPQGKSAPENTVTRYVDGLKQGVSKAEAVAKEANQSKEAIEKSYEQFLNE